MDIEHYRRFLPVRKNHLDEELEIQSQYMDEIAQQVTRANSAMLSAKENLAKVDADLARDLRLDTPKMAVAAIAAELAREPEHIEAVKRYNNAKEEYETWNHLLEAWRQKGFSIRVMADLYAAQYFTISSTRAPAAPYRQADPRGRESVATYVQTQVTARRKINVRD